MKNWGGRLAAITCVLVGCAAAHAQRTGGEASPGGALPGGVSSGWSSGADEVAREARAPGETAGGDCWLGRPVRVALFWDNDGGPPGLFADSDKHYTNGLKIDIAWKPEWADTLASIVPFEDHFGGPVDTAVGFSVGQLMFTPRNLAAHRPITHDQPYAGWLAFSVYWQRAGTLTDNIAMFDHIELDGGIVGQWSGAEPLQKAVHAFLPDQQRPNGWDNQLHNEPAFDLTIRRKLRFSSGRTDEGFEFQAIPSFGGTLGTVYRQLEGSVTARLGWNLPDDFGPRRLSDVGAATGGWSSDFGFYVFVLGQARLVEHDIFLDGNTWQYSQSVSKEPVVLEAQVGVVALLWRHFEIGWSETFMTDRFHDQPGGGDRYGSITLAWVASF